MKLTLQLEDDKIAEIIEQLERWKKERPTDYKSDITGYWEHHLSKMSIRHTGKDRVCVEGESGFYFPGTTYSGLDFLNTLYKRYGLMRDMVGTKYDLSLPVQRTEQFGYHLSGKWTSFDFLRSIHHARKIVTIADKNNITLPEQLRIMEIGSGTGVQALVFKLLFPKSTYILVDLPETLALAQVFLSLMLPRSKFLSISKETLIDSDVDKYDFIFVPNYAVGVIPDNSAHLALNTVSMQEMNYDTIDMYFMHIRRILTDPSLFYQCNRDKKMGSTFIKVCLYPYKKQDVSLYQALDEFHKITIVSRKCFGRFPVLRKIKILVLRFGGHITSLTKMAK